MSNEHSPQHDHFGNKNKIKLKRKKKSLARFTIFVLCTKGRKKKHSVKQTKPKIKRRRTKKQKKN